MTARLFFGVACYDAVHEENFFMRQLAFFQFMPQWIAVFNAVMSLVDNDLYFFVSSNLTLLLLYYYLLALSLALRFGRPVGYDAELCHVDEFAFPDARYVATLTYIFVVAAGLSMDERKRRQFGYFRRAVFGLATLAYSASLLANGYFSLWQFAANTALAIVFAVTYLCAYWQLVHVYDIARGSRHWLARTLGLTDHVFSRQHDRGHP